MVSTWIGPRRDLEWAIADGRPSVLQDRPITNLPSENPIDVWSRRFGDEYLAEFTLPLPEDLMLSWIVDMSLKEMARLQGRRDMASIAPIRLHQGLRPPHVCPDHGRPSSCRGVHRLDCEHGQAP